MARILFCWELGGGLGHLSSFAPFAAELRRRGHQLCLAARSPQRVPLILGEGWTAVPAPILKGAPESPFSPVSSYVRLLWNAAWGESENALAARLLRWREIFTSFSPHLAIFDHAPTALLATRGLPIPRLMLGAPFCCPGTLGRFHDFYGRSDEHDAQEESDLCARINRVLARLGWPEIECLQDIFRVEGVHLTSFPELDPFERPEPPRYLGHFPGSNGAPPAWPSEAPGEPRRPKVFAYLKDGPVAERTVEVLSRLRLPSVVYLGGRTRVAGPTVAISEQPIQMETATRDCDLAITNATHGTTACLLTAGKPMLLFPKFMEQHLTARKAVDLGLGQLGQPSSLRAIGAGIAQLLEEPRFAEAARQAAGRLAGFAPDARLLASIESIEQLAAGPPGP